MSIRSARAALASLIKRHWPRMAQAFMSATSSLKSTADLKAMIEALKRRDVEGAISILGIDASAYSPVHEALRSAFIEGGTSAADNAPKKAPDGRTLVIRFDGRNPEAERWLESQSSRLISGIVEDQRRAVRTSLTESLAIGANPRDAAVAIVGRLNRATGKREGGILGLTAAQEAYVRTARTELASADTQMLRNYLERARRDRRFDRSVEKAIREGVALPKEIAERAANAYESRLLRLRGETIGRVETMSALQTAKYEAYRQAIASGKVKAENVDKVWRSARDSRVRDTHAVLDGKVVKFDVAFRSFSGQHLMHPMDRSLGAGAAEIVNCRCDCDYRINFYAGLT